MVKPSYAQKWLMCEILPMAAVVGATFFVTRNLSINPDVRISKEDRAAGLLDNYEEGRMYRDHEFRKYLSVQNKTVMPAFNDYFSEILPNFSEILPNCHPGPCSGNTDPAKPAQPAQPVEFVETLDSDDPNLPVCP